MGSVGQGVHVALDTLKNRIKGLLGLLVRINLVLIKSNIIDYLLELIIPSKDKKNNQIQKGTVLLTYLTSYLDLKTWRPYSIF